MSVQGRLVLDVAVEVLVLRVLCSYGDGEDGWRGSG